MMKIKTHQTMRRGFISLALLAVIASAMCGCMKREGGIKRDNRLRKLFSTDLSGLSVESRQSAMKYVTLWMKVFDMLGTSGIAIEGRESDAYTKELLPIIQHLENGNELEKEAFKAGVKIHVALEYLGTCQRMKKPFDNVELNALLRYEPGNESDPEKLSQGVANLLFDYVQMVDKASFRKAVEAGKMPPEYMSKP
jgi:hypothetical protein